MRIRLIASLSVLVLNSSAAVIGCSSDDAPAAAPAPVVTPAAGTRITAAAGGKVSDPAGKVTLSIPAGALAADTDITVAVIAPSGGSASDVFELGPDGLQFAKPVAIEIKGDKGLAPEGKTLALAVFEGGAFKPLADSAFDGTKATATITHFSRYALVIVDGQAIPTLQAKVFKKGTCVDKGSGVCQCTEVQDPPQEEQVSTYTTSGNTITSTDAKGGVTTSEYCVSGAGATSRAPDVDGKKGGLFSLKRK